MGRLIDTNDLHNKVMLNKSDWGIFATQIDNLIESIVMQAPTVEAIPKDQYEARLKADMVAMLEDLKQDFIAEAYGIEMDCTDYVVNVADIDKIIQQKINELKGDQRKE